MSTLIRFIRDTSSHQLEVIREDGLYRHLRFSRPNTRAYSFDIVTWPGYLTVTHTNSPSMSPFSFGKMMPGQRRGLNRSVRNGVADVVINCRCRAAHYKKKSLAGFVLVGMK